MLTRHDTLTILLLAGVLALLALPVLTYPLGRDQGEFATIAVGVLDGQLPYRDLWNPKPPAVFYTYALPIAIFGNTAAAVRSLDVALVVLMVPALYLLGGMVQGRALGVLAAVLFGAVYLTEDFWTLSQNDGLVLVPMTYGVLCALQAARGGSGRGRLGWSAAAGGLAALVLWFKYPFVTYVAALVGMYTLLRAPWHRSQRRAFLQDAAVFVLSGCVVGFGVMGILWQYDAFDAWLESARVTADYAQLGVEGEPFYESVIWQAAVETRWQQWRGVVVLAVPGALLGGVRWVYRRINRSPFQDNATLSAQNRYWLAVVLWLIGGAGAMLIQAKGYDYHWLPMLPPLVILAAGAVAQLVTLSGRRALLALSVAVILAGSAAEVWYPALPYLDGTQSQQAYYTEFRGGEYVAAESQVVVDYLRERTEPGETLFIWGFRAEVYYLTGLRPATRFIFNFPLVAAWYPPAWQVETNSQLWQTMPPYAIVMRGDFMPWVTGRDMDSQLLLFEVPDIRAWLEFNYERDVELGNFLVWRLKDTPGAGS